MKPNVSTATGATGWRRPGLVLAALFVAIIAIRLISVYPPTLRHDPATEALQACRILDGERPLFWPGQAWMGTAGMYVEALLFHLFGKNTLVMSLYAWVMAGAWIFLSLLLALRFFGRTVAVITALIWLVPTKTLMYWSSQARPNHQFFYISTPAILLMTHDIVVRYREGKSVTGRMLFLGFFCGFSFWSNMAIGPGLVVTFAVLMLHLRREFWTRQAWVYAPAWLLGFLPVLYYNLTTDVALAETGRFPGLSAIAKAVRDLFTNVLPIFWGFEPAKPPWTLWQALQILFQIWTLLLLGLYAVTVYRKWRRREDLLVDQLVLGLLAFHIFVPTVTQYSKSFATPGNPILYITNLYSLAFTILAVGLARFSGVKRLLLALPLLIYFGNNVSNTLLYPRNFFTALREQGPGAIEHFPNPEHPLVRALVEKGLSRGYSESTGPWLSLAGLHLVVFARPAADRVVDYALAVDGAKHIFWVPQAGLPEPFSMVGSRFETGPGFYYGFEKDPQQETLLEQYTVRAGLALTEIPAVSDRRLDTLWGLPALREQTTVVFEFPAPERIGKITLLPESHKTIPPHLTLQRSLDGQAWTTVAEWTDADVFFWSVRHPFQKMVKPRCEMVIPEPEPARFLRIVIHPQRGSFSLREAYLYHTAPPTAPAVTVDDEVAALEKALAPVRKTHRIVGDHYFMAHFKLAGFDVEFISNRIVNNHGKVNPSLDPLRELDFSRPLALIVPHSHGNSAARLLDQAHIRYDLQRLAFHDLYLTSPGRAAAHLAWTGFDLALTLPSR